MVVGFIIHEVQWRYFNRESASAVQWEIETEVAKQDSITR